MHFRSFILKRLLILIFCTFSSIAMKADTTNFSYNLRVSSSLAGLNQGNSSDSLKQFTGNIQNVFYYHVKHFGFGIGTGLENSMFYVSDKSSFYRVYEAPVFVSFKLTSNEEKFHFFQNFGLATPVKSKLPDIGTGYYFQCGIGAGSRQLKGEVAYKIISLGRDKGPLLNYNITFGLCLTLK